MKAILRYVGGRWTGPATACTGYRGIVVTTRDKEDTPFVDILPPEQIPGPRILPLIGNLYNYLPGGKYDFSKVAKSHIKMYEQYGPIVRERYGPYMNIVRLFNVKDVEKLMRVQGKCPIRPMNDIFAKTAEDLGRPTILVAVDGEEWHRQRSAVQKDMMHPRTVVTYMPAQEEVAAEFVEHLRKKRNSEGEVVNILKNFHEFCLEAFGLVVYDRRLGVFDVTEENKDNHVGYKVIHNAGVLFENLLPLMNWSYFVEKGFFKKRYQTFLRAADNLFQITDRLMGEAEEKGDSGKQTVLRALLKNKKLSRGEAANLMAGFLAGVETTAFTLSHIIYRLAKNPEVQEKLYEELNRELPDGKGVTYDILSSKLKYLRATIRETGRICPVSTTSITRTLDHDEIFGGYKVPAGWILTVENAAMSLLPKYFEDPEEFRPERWLTEDRDFQKQSAFIVLPWGHGARGCIGKRFAEQELYLATIKLIQNFKIEYHHRDLDVVNYTLQELDGPLNVKLIDRN